MKLGTQGELTLVPNSSYLEIASRPTEINTREGFKPFSGGVKVQPHFLKTIWEVLENEREKAIIRSAGKLLVVKYQPEKNRIRISFKGEDGTYSSYILFGNAFARFKDLFLDSVKKLKVVSIQNGDFSGTKAGNFVILRKGTKELYLDEDMKEKLKEIILKNYLIKKPVKIDARNYQIDEEGNLIIKGLKIPKESVKEVYLFLL